MSVFTSIKQSCEHIADNATHISINNDAIEKFVASTPSNELISSETVVYPLKFASVMERVNFMGLAALIEVGSGFRKELHSLCNRGAHDTMAFGLMSAFLTSKNRLDANWMTNITMGDVSGLFGMPIDTEREVMPGVYLSESNGPLAPLARLITTMLNEAGTNLTKAGYGDLATMIYDTLSNSSNASELVLRLAEIVPGFDDRESYKTRSDTVREAMTADDQILFLKKAQLLVADLFLQLGNTDPLFNFEDINDVCVFIDNVIPAVLRHLGVLDLDEELTNLIDSNTAIPRGSVHEIELRACGIHACNLIVDAYSAQGSDVKAVNLDFFLWRKGKEDDFRKVERHATKDTCFY